MTCLTGFYMGFAGLQGRWNELSTEKIDQSILIGTFVICVGIRHRGVGHIVS